MFAKLRVDRGTMFFKIISVYCIGSKSLVAHVFLNIQERLRNAHVCICHVGSKLLCIVFTRPLSERVVG